MRRCARGPQGGCLAYVPCASPPESLARPPHGCATRPARAYRYCVLSRGRGLLLSGMVVACGYGAWSRPAAVAQGPVPPGLIPAARAFRCS